MGNTDWDELMRSMPDSPDDGEDDDEQRVHERLNTVLCTVIDALDDQPPAEEILDVLERGIERLQDVTGAVGGTLFVKDESSGELAFVVVKGEGDAEKLRWRTLARGYGIAGWVVEHGKHVVTNDTEYDSRFCSWFDEELHYKTKTVLAVPIVNRRRVLGAVELVNKADNGLFTNDDLAATRLFANITGQVLADLDSRGEMTLS